MTDPMTERSADLDGFRQTARSWLVENFPAALAHRPAPGPGVEEGAETDDARLWKTRMGEKGWGVPTWPARYGGGELSPAQARVLAEEMTAIGAQNPIGGMGVMMFGPTLLEYGNEDQKARHLPPIARGELRWCQGFSEPGAGSDLASLSTRAQDRGDHWLVNGQKIWTSGAHLADWCFCLVRTDTSKKHEGISFLLIDMKSPGVEARPILLIAGNSPFCETFFTDVKVPKENLVGPLNGGWTIAKRLLQHERSGLAGAAGAQRAQVKVPLPQLAKAYLGADEAGRIADLDLRQRIINYEMDLKAFQQTAERAALEARSNRGPSAATSIMKNAGSFLRRDGAELTVEIMGWQGLGWSGDPFSDDELAATRTLGSSKAGTIAGGSQEVQYNIIAKRILGLPDPISAAARQG
ncbi:MAG: acyl-CoA dehydrogenase family protein [Phenylobacterium sp.]|uniref:acyl-CoA dehydrogenase family protein n=1 Tax=Phenylobacterium sp. TaxID=1871053 RepID=UPI00271C22BF|nr:acyl-CoA dehydrogenase family protein [Phenylobacterium sp.]MDO8900599.1 acyl-CoA dehydrogenase family protein [Phenylobacterium sp.]